MKLMKRAVLAMASLAMLLSLSPLIAVDEQDYGSGGNSSGSWRVTCVYDGQERLISKSCSSGGNNSCNCP